MYKKDYVLTDWQQGILREYYKDDAIKLHKVIDKLLFELKFKNIVKEDFYSLANEMFLGILLNYDNKKDFYNFLYSCLYKKFCTEMTRRNSYKRCIKIQISDNKVRIIRDLSLDAPMKGYEKITIGESVARKDTLEEEFFKKYYPDEHQSDKMKQYLSQLSPFQRKIANLIMDGYSDEEIQDILHITKRKFNDQKKALRAYRNISIFFN